MLKTSLLIISLIGSLFFGTLFGLTYGVSEGVERAGQNFIKAQIEKEFAERSDEFSQNLIGDKYTGKLKYLKKLNQKSIDKTQLYLDAKMPEMITTVIASMCNLDCNEKQEWTESIKTGFEENIEKMGISSSRMSDFIKGKYHETLAGLKLDLRIFLGSNALLFGLVLIISIVKARAVKHLYLPAGLLLISTFISIAIYIFGQNWFFTIIYNDFMGFGYLAYVGTLFAVLCDIIFNKGRVTTTIINFIGNIIGSAFSVVPC